MKTPHYATVINAPPGSGMTSMIAENRPDEFVSIKHLGIVKDGIDVEVTPAFEACMADTRPKALCEAPA